MPQSLLGRDPRLDRPGWGPFWGRDPVLWGRDPYLISTLGDSRGGDDPNEWVSRKGGHDPVF